MQEEKQKIVLVIGDIILDKTYFGRVERISPEAPCLVFNQSDDRVESLGGAAYVASQLATLAIPVSLCGTIACDAAGRSVQNMLEEKGIGTELMFTSAEQTTTKNRYVTHEKLQQVFRVDSEHSHRLAQDEQNFIMAYIRETANILDHVVLIDYEKGVLSDSFCQEIIALCNRLTIPTFVDIKSSSCAKYKGANTIKGNQKEIQQMLVRLGCEDTDYPALKKELECANLIMTCGADGISYISEENTFHHEGVIRRHSFDVTGAGDIVSAFYIASIRFGKSIHESISIANRAAGIKVSTFGCPVLTWDEIWEKKSKLLTIDGCRKCIHPGKTIVFTNGCFDVLHAGHVDLLQKAASYGDILVVGLNSDNSIRRIKGESRPINNLDSRVAVLSALECVDYIIVFDEDTPLNIIREICPDVLVKGADYSMNQIVGAEYVEAHGGKVIRVPFTYPVSSSMILNKL